jgi:hypothetical protein
LLLACSTTVVTPTQTEGGIDVIVEIDGGTADAVVDVVHAVDVVDVVDATDGAIDSGARWGCAVEESNKPGSPVCVCAVDSTRTGDSCPSQAFECCTLGVREGGKPLCTCGYALYCQVNGDLHGDVPVAGCPPPE